MARVVGWILGSPVGHPGVATSTLELSGTPPSFAPPRRRFEESAAALLGAIGINPEESETIPFACGDTTGGSETEPQAVFFGSRETTACRPRTIEGSNYFANTVRRTESGDLPPCAVNGLECYRVSDQGRRNRRRGERSSSTCAARVSETAPGPVQGRCSPVGFRALLASQGIWVALFLFMGGGRQTGSNPSSYPEVRPDLSASSLDRTVWNAVCRPQPGG